MGLKKLSNTRPFAKIGIQGFAGDGKTYTAALIAVGIHKLIGSKKPIAIFDTERASKALIPLFDKNNIEVLVDEENRSLAALNSVIAECENGAADILIIDSITHVYEEFMKAYMTEKRKTRLEFQDWGVIKPAWKTGFSNRYVQSPLHIIFTGRSGYEYENEVNADTGKREIFKSGVKMKAENETAFEPDILIDMQKVKIEKGVSRRTLKRLATIIKDRTNMIDGKEFENPTFKNFEPAIKVLLNGVLVVSQSEEIKDKFEDSDEKFYQQKAKKERLIEEINGSFNYMGLGTSVEHKRLKAAIFKKVFGTTTDATLSTKKLVEVELGAEAIQLFADDYLMYMTYCNENEIKVPDMAHIQGLLEAAIEQKSLLV